MPRFLQSPAVREAALLQLLDLISCQGQAFLSFLLTNCFGQYTYLLALNPVRAMWFKEKGKITSIRELE